MKQEIIRLLERAKEDGRTIGDVLAEVRGIAEPVAAQAPTGNTTIPAGWKLVPIEPTTAMAIDGVNAGFDHNDEPYFIYAAMLNAAPAPPAASAAPSDDELSALYLFADGHPFHEWLRRARALLSRYGQAPAASAKPRCWCQTCRPITMDDMRMVVCPTCGNKRCPRATDHRNACTGSNEPGQNGSSYERCTAPVAAQQCKGGKQ